MIWVKYTSGVIWGHMGQKVIFSKNATSDPEYMVLSAQCNRVYPCYHVTHKYALTWDSEMHSLVQGQLRITSADRVRRLWRQHVSSSLPCRFRRQGIVFFVFLSSSASGNTSTANNFNISWLISTKLGHNNPYLRGIMSLDQQGVKGHVGSVGSKRSFFTKNASPFTNFEPWSCDLHIWSIYLPCTVLVLF